MGIEALFTTQTQTQTVSGTKPIAAGLASSNFAFLDLILGAITGNGEVTSAQKSAIKKALKDAGNNEPGNTDIQALLMGLFKPQDGAQEQTFNLPKLLSLDSTVAGEIGAIQDMGILDGNSASEIAHVLLLNQQAMDQTLAPLSDGALTTQEIAHNPPGIEKALLLQQEREKELTAGNLVALLKKLESMAQDTGFALQNMTPAQITTLQKKVESLMAQGNLSPGTAQNIDRSEMALSGIDFETLDADLSKLVQSILTAIRLAQPAPEDSVLMVTAPLSSKTLTDNDTALAARLNAMNVGDGGIVHDGALPFFNPQEPSESFTDFDLNGVSTNTQTGKKLPMMNNVPGTTVAPQTPAQSGAALLGWMASAPMPPVSSAEDWARYYDDMAVQGTPMNAASSADATSILTRAPFAGGAHPATNAVAVAIQKYASDGVNKNFSLQLDPPELGRVEVRLTFGKDKSVKAVVMAERPETVSMLQRDSYILERALTGAGLSADSSSLSFELAGDGHFNDGGGDNNSGRGTAVSNDTQSIESTMTWFIDPETGRMRYDFLI